MSSSNDELKRLNPRAAPLEIVSGPISTDNDLHYGDSSCWSSLTTESNKKRIVLAMIVTTIFISLILFVRNFEEKHEPHYSPVDPNHLNDFGFDKADILQRPFSAEDPRRYGFLDAERSEDSKPGSIMSIVREEYTALPTNSWCENLLLGPGTTENNHVYQLPYLVDAAGPVPGLRTHPVRTKASFRDVMMIYEPNNELTLSAVEPLERQYKVVGQGQKTIGRLLVMLQWQKPGLANETSPYTMTAHVARGSPYMSAVYENATPLLRAEASLIYTPIIDGDPKGAKLVCGDMPGIFSEKAAYVNRHVQLRFHASDMTWMVFFSEPVELVCSSTALDELSSIPPFFEMRAKTPMKKGMVRIALVNNCTTGVNPRYCEQNQPRDKEDYRNLIIEHADLYPTPQAEIGLIYPKQFRQSKEDIEEYMIQYLWNPSSMKALSGTNDSPDEDESDKTDNPMKIPRKELLMLGVAHHQKLMTSVIGSSNTILDDPKYCTSSLHGMMCPILGGVWAIRDTLFPASLLGKNHQPRREILPDLISSVKTDIKYRIPDNYRRGAGDTYFSGKVLAKLARILLVDEGLGAVVPAKDFNDALDHLRQTVEVWLNGSAAAPFVYDKAWGGMLNCGCQFNGDTQGCDNIFPNCPGVANVNMNFGFGYYNDHHFHLGYHIFAAGVVAKFDPAWGKRFYQHVMFLVRDIANPSPDDPYFIDFRHVDWYLGFSWASGIVSLGGVPYLNGKNWESSSEAISAYEGVALFGHVMANICYDDIVTALNKQSLLGSSSSTNAPKTLDDIDPVLKQNYENALRVKTVGRILMSMTVRAAKVYYHIQSPGTNGTVRVYPVEYAGKAVGMMWSMMMEQQTWFGNEAWKAYGIQVIPITPITEHRDGKGWLKEMLPLYEVSCDNNPDCKAQGWSVPIFISYARFGEWEKGWKGIKSLPASVFETAGGNGHSRSNSLWFLATYRE